MKRTLLVLVVACALVVFGAVGAWVAAPHDSALAAATAAAGVASPPGPQPARTVTLSRAARVDGVPLRLDITLLRRVGRTATLDLRLRSTAAHGGRTFDVDNAFGEWDVSEVYLVDPATGRRLAVEEDADGCVCTSEAGGIEIAPGGTAMLTASFPAPSRGVRSADVVVPHFGAFRDVPLREG